MALTEFLLPDLGEGLEEAEIIEWHVAPGDRVVADQPLVSVETGKAVVEIPAPWSGTVSALRAEVGASVKVGAPLVAFDRGARADQGAVVGRLERASPQVPLPAPAGAVARPGKTPRAMPAARAFAAKHGVDLSTVAGSGPDGVITLADVEVRAQAPAGPGWAPLEGSRRAMAKAMAAAGARVVPATIHDWADVTAWASPKADILARLVRGVAEAARAEPALNAWFDAEAPARRLNDRVHIGLAVDTEAGLYVPVLRDAGSRDAKATRAELDRLVARARDRKLTAEDQSGATIGLSNYGPLAGTHAQLVVTPPQVAILGAGRLTERVGWGKDVPRRRRALPLSLSFDHRAVTGGEAARFLNAAIADLKRKT